MRTDADDLARVCDPAIELLLSHAQSAAQSVTAWSRHGTPIQPLASAVTR